MIQGRFMSGVAAAVAGVGLWSAPVSAQMYPVQATGWNRDIVVERTAVAPWSAAAMSFDTFNNWSWYERGLAGTLGLPQGGAFASVVDPTTLGQLQPYNALNALFLDVTTATGSLTLVPAAQTRYDALAIFASSSNGGGSGTLVVTFTDASTSASIVLNAGDWFNVTTNNALNALGRANLGTSTVEATTGSNPRIYQTSIDMVALGLNGRAVQSISFTKPTGGNAQNTVVMGISGRRSVTQMNPLSATGWNRDVVVESTAVVPFSGAASAFDVANNLAWYETGLPGSTKGLPPGGGFNSAANSVIHAQLQPYGGPNVLFLNITLTAASGTLTLAPGAQVPYEFLAVFANSAGGGGAGSMVVTFTDATTSGPLPFNAQDWFNVTTNNAIINAGRANLTTNVIDDASAGNPRLYQSVIDLATLGLGTRPVQSITFTKPTTGTSAAIWAISGQAASAAPGACCAATGVCSVVVPANCGATGLFQGPGTACASGATCSVPAIACCNITSGACAYVNGTGCVSGSVSQGTGSVCSPNPCPVVVCCDATTGACATAFSACPAGSNLATGTSCSPSPCPPSGSCCSGSSNQSCSVVVQTACTGVYNGNATVCTPNPCYTSDECQTTTLVLTVGTTVTGSNVGATNSVAVTQTGTGFCTQTTFSTGIALDVFWKFTAPATAVYDLHTCGSTLDTILSVHSGCPVSNANLLDCNDDSTSGTGNLTCATVIPGSSGLGSHIPTITLTQGTLYYIRVAGFNGAVGNYSLTINLVSTTGSCCVATTCSVTDAANCTGTYTDGGTCTPSPCGGAAGLCCRGATCNTTIATAVDCTNSLIGGQVAGAAFVLGTVCNTGAVSNAPCCYADYNKASGITVSDIFNFLTDWFGGSPFANVGGTGAPGALTVQNIFDFLGNWFAGGC